MNALLSIVGLIASLAVVANIFIAFGVWKDAERLSIANGNTLRILSAPQWAFACLFAGFPILAIYALLHYSTFAARPTPADHT
jgi:hypothetical protein